MRPDGFDSRIYISNVLRVACRRSPILIDDHAEFGPILNAGDSPRGYPAIRGPIGTKTIPSRMNQDRFENRARLFEERKIKLHVNGVIKFEVHFKVFGVGLIFDISLKVRK